MVAFRVINQKLTQIIDTKRVHLKDVEDLLLEGSNVVPIEFEGLLCELEILACKLFFLGLPELLGAQTYQAENDDHLITG